ncbi:hypothetical protein LOTGIDRAFT_231063 [Lottia gigantea]|uniref:Proline-rich transmembrane protein 3/4 domain-containing protein n=1 Tax=Lottia gigantea TaxID=225164 RepID=V4B050_LOTGI|nr:hypothetical protein LOTGIDRAFT_231063 [Lottia gigantea]ESO99401.1 hypothetical protein LOTGIDRAFT_231063 [Lottia gigantea]
MMHSFHYYDFIISGNEANVFRSLPSMNNDIHKNLNSSSTINSLLPLPDWQIAKNLWRSGWPIYIYGFSSLFLLVSLVPVLLCIRYKQRVYRLRAVLNIIILLSVGGLIRLFYLVVDPYGYNQILSPVVIGVLSQLIYPLLCASYGLFQIMLLQMTRLDVGNSKLRNSTPLLAWTLIYLFSIVLIEVIVYYENETKFLLILDNGFFIVFALYLCISFICNGFRLSQYASETKRVRKQFELFNNDRKNSQPPISVSRSSTSLRLARPRLKITDKYQMTITIASEAETTSSDDCSVRTQTRVRKRRHKKTHQNVKLVTSQSGTRSDVFDSNGKYSEESGLYGVSDTSGGLDILNISRNHIVTSDTQQLSPTVHVPSLDLMEQSCVNYSSGENSLHCDNETMCPEANIDQFPEENGYMADTEIVVDSPKRSGINYNQVKQDNDVCGPNENLSDHLKSTTSFISLYRIRQGLMIQKTIQITYCTTFLFLFAVLLQLYTVFGVYGVLNTNTHPEPWPWFTFQTFFRSTEVGICTSLLMTVYIVLKHRKHSRRKQRTSQLICDANCVV